jgi:hypothetical protein
MILREFFRDYLYNQDYGYFHEGPVHISEPLQFKQMFGESAYKKALFNQYQGAHGFLTPVEIFKPHYARALANYIVSTNAFQENTLPLNIIEIGGGNGTCAVGILDYLKTKEKKLYEKTQYTIVDVSKKFHQIQKQTLANHTNKIRLENKDFLQWEETNINKGIVIGLEVLDNMPHDKVIFDETQNKFYETWIDVMSEKEFVEQRRDLTDPLIIDYLQTIKSFYGLTKNEDNKLLWDLLQLPVTQSVSAKEELMSVLKSKRRQQFLDYIDVRNPSGLFSFTKSVNKSAMYLPTTSLLMLKKIRRQFPLHKVILADFEELEDAMSDGVNGPLVHRTEGNKTKIYQSYLQSPALGTCDIYFPTNFDNLDIVYKQIYGVKDRSRVTFSTAEFMRRYANTSLTETKSKYNPLLEDFTNTKFLISDASQLPATL